MPSDDFHISSARQCRHCFAACLCVVCGLTGRETPLDADEEECGAFARVSPCYTRVSFAGVLGGSSLWEVSSLLGWQLLNQDLYCSHCCGGKRLGVPFLVFIGSEFAWCELCSLCVCFTIQENSIILHGFCLHFARAWCKSCSCSLGGSRKPCFFFFLLGVLNHVEVVMSRVASCGLGSTWRLL